MHARADVERARLARGEGAATPVVQRPARRLATGRIGEGYRDQDEITALLTLNLPLFSPWQNKSHRQHEAAIASYEEARRMLGQRIDQQVAFAIQAVQSAAAGLAEFARAENAGASGSETGSRPMRPPPGTRPGASRLTAEEQFITSSRGRLQALYHYNQAVARLEQAIGLPIEEAFARRPNGRPPAA